MTADTNPVPAAPTPLTDDQAAAILGANALRTYPDEHLVLALLQPDHPSPPRVRSRLPRLVLTPIADDVAKVRQRWHDPNDEVA